MSGTDFPGNWRSVLAVTDPGPAGEDVLAAAARVAFPLGAELHVLDGLGLIGAHLGEALPLLHGTYVQSRARLLEEQVERAIPEGRRPASITLEYRRADQALAARAEAVDADLIVVPAREPSPVGFAPPRETLAAAALRTGRPTLLARGELTWPPTRVVGAALEGAGGAGRQVAARYRSKWLSDMELETLDGIPGGVLSIARGALIPTGSSSLAARLERAYARAGAAVHAAAPAWLEPAWAAAGAPPDSAADGIDLVVMAAPPAAFERGGEGTRIVTALARAMLLLPLTPEGTPHAQPGAPAAALAPQ